MDDASRLIPRQMIFSDPDRTGVSLSRDGLRLAWLEARDGVLNLMVGPITDLSAARQLTHGTSRSLTPVVIWAHTNEHVIIFRDEKGDENYHAASVNVETGVEIPLTQGDGIKSFHWADSPTLPTKMLFGLNARDRRNFDVILVDIATGFSRPVFENPGLARLHIGADFTVRFGDSVRPDGSVEIMQRRTDGGWSPFLIIPPDDVLTTRLDRLSSDGQSAFLLDSRGRDKAALIELDLATRSATLLAEDPDGDITNVVYHPRTARPLAAMALAARQRWYPIEAAFAPDLERLLLDANAAELTITDLSENLDRQLVFIDRSDAVGEFRLFERATHSVHRLFKSRSDLDKVPLQPMRIITIAASDGLTLRGYLTLPEKNFLGGPMVLAVHGGPYDRDVWGYSALHQWLASRGYAVLSVNFRGSTGFGKAFIRAADQEWGGRMQDDLNDAAAWAIEQGYADPARIGLFGVSYGGYASLMAAAKTPEAFACYVDVFGPSSLITFMESIPPYWQTWFAMIKRRLADPATEKGHSWLIERSPLTHVDRIVRPMLIVQGLNDARVKPRESEQIVHALQERGVPVVYLTFSDEGHFFMRGQNRIAFSAVMEAFLARYLGGSAETLGGNFSGSSIRIEAGSELIPGIQ